MSTAVAAVAAVVVLTVVVPPLASAVTCRDQPQKRGLIPRSPGEKVPLPKLGSATTYRTPSPSPPIAMKKTKSCAVGEVGT